ncbi:hypothetical protein B0T24DRAFT_383202 [Lasiosphaeria ovina]|uniref:Secreted peptide n=1 Tax=Lasiosphaeria ovina TaxID=92902 RepID=A0AAE0JZX7_9PEZI|nr:hypothetical protein B0T24DRAFT_383202 [Lasiosphaeria ovina]
MPNAALFGLLVLILLLVTTSINEFFFSLCLHANQKRGHLGLDYIPFYYYISFGHRIGHYAIDRGCLLFFHVLPSTVYRANLFFCLFCVITAGWRIGSRSRGDLSRSGRNERLSAHTIFRLCAATCYTSWLLSCLVGRLAVI